MSPPPCRDSLITTSSTSAGSRPERRTASPTTVVARSNGSLSTSVPRPAVPMAVRAVETMQASAIGGEAQVDGARLRLRPAGGDHLGPGVEADPLGAVHRAVAEDRRLPATEAVPRHGDRDGHVDAHHAHV